MRQIPLLTVEMGKAGGQELGKQNYGDMIIGVVESKQPGMTLTELRKSLSVVEAVRDAMKNEAEHVLLENDDYQYLRGCILERRYPVAASEVLRFVDVILEAKTVNPNADKTAKPAKPDAEPSADASAAATPAAGKTRRPR